MLRPVGHAKDDDESMLTPIDNLSVHVPLELENAPLLRQNEQDQDEPMKLVKAEKAANKSKPATKVLFLDGLRGLASILVVVQHSKVHIQDLNLGGVAVDTFFVLSSFLLTWLFMKKSIQMLHQRAGVRAWIFALADYFSKRFFRVYPLFVFTCLVLWFMDDKAKQLYFFIGKTSPSYDLYKVLTFEFDYRYHAFWSLPLEIAYYFFIPVFVLGVLLLRRWWWVPYIPACCWVVNEGINVDRSDHMDFRTHCPTFLVGSMAAVLFVKLDTWIKASKFQFRFIHKLILRTIEYTALAVLFNLAFRGLFFVWVPRNPPPPVRMHPFVSVVLSLVLLCEMLLPSPLSSMLEWNLLRHWGKISFSVYLLHSFVVFNKHIRYQPNYYRGFFSRFGLVWMLATISYHLIEYPSQLLAQRVTKALKEQETKGSGGLTVLLGGRGIY